MEVSRFISVVEYIANIPYYSVVGSVERRIIYVSNRDGIRRAWIYDPVENKSYPITKHPSILVAIPRHSESNTIIYTYDVAHGKELHRLCIVDIEKGTENCLEDLDPMRIFSLVWNGTTIALVGSTSEALYLVIIREGHVVRKRRLDFLIEVSDIYGEHVVGHGMLAGNPRSSELFVYNIGNDEFKVFTPRQGSINENPVFCNDKLLFESNYEDMDVKKLYTINLGLTSEPEKLMFKYDDYSDFDPVEHIYYDCISDKAYVVAKKNGRTKVFVDGRLVPTPIGSIGRLGVLGNKIYYSASSLVEPYQIYCSTSNNFDVVLPNPLPDDIRNSLGDRYFVKIRSTGQVDVPTYIIESRKTGKPGPTIVYVHGGPWAEIMDTWSPIIASIVATGHHVVAPNYRGSTGYGEKYRLLDIGDPGGGDLEDVVSAAKYAVETRLASSVAIVGYSYGGYMAYLATTRYPELWRAGVAGAGIVDWLEQYMLSDALFRRFIEILFDGYRPELLRERSPISYADKLSCPLCIIHASNDTRTPLKPVLRFMEKLFEKQKIFEAHIYPGLGHMLTTTNDLLKYTVPMLVFLQKTIERVGEAEDSKKD